MSLLRGVIAERQHHPPQVRMTSMPRSPCSSATPFSRLSPVSTTRTRKATLVTSAAPHSGQLILIMTIGLLPDRSGRLPDVMDPGIHGVRTRWIRGFMAFQLDRRARTVMLVVPM